MTVRSVFSSIFPRLELTRNFACSGFVGREKNCPRFILRVFLVLSLFALLAVLFGSPVVGAEAQAEPFEVFRLRHISSVQGQDYLGQLGIGIVSTLPGQPMLLVTGGSLEMRKARAILKLVDSPERYVIRELSSGSGIKAPSGERTRAILREIEIGTFSDPPFGSGAKAIVDLHDNSFVVVAPLSKIEKIIGAFTGSEKVGALGVVSAAVITDSVEAAVVPSLVEEVSSSAFVIPKAVGGFEVKPSKVEAVGPASPVLLKSQGDLPDNGGTNGLFGKLLKNLSEAEAKAAERAKPAEKKVATKVVEKTEPVAEVAEANAVEPVVEKPEAVVETTEVADANEVPAPEVVVESNEPVKEIPEEKKAKEKEKDTELEALMDRITSLEAQLKDWSVTDSNEEEVSEPEAKVETKAEPKTEAKVEAVADVNKAAPKIEKRIEEPVEAAVEDANVVADANVVEDVNTVADANVVADVNTVAEANSVADANSVSDANAEVAAAKQSIKETKARPSKKFRIDEIPNADDILKISLPKEPLPLIDFLDFVGKHLHLDYLYDPDKMKTIKVNLRRDGQLSGEITIRELYSVLESVLFFNNFVMTEKDGLMIVRPNTEINLSDPKIVPPDADRLGHGNIVITTTFKLEHIDTGSAQNMLKNMNLGVQIIPVEETKTLIVTGYAHRMDQMEQLLEMVDKPGIPKQYRERQLKYTMAELLAPKIKTLAEQIGTVSVSVSAAAAKPSSPSRTRARGRGGSKPPSPPRAKTAAPKVAPDSVYLEADPRTNRILMIGHDKQLRIVEKLIDSLDVEQQDLRLLHLYKIINVDAEEVRLKLEEFRLISATTRTTQRGRSRSRDSRSRTASRSKAAAKGGASDRITSPTTGGASTEKPLSEEPQVVIIETINALLVNASPEQHVRIATIIGYVDSEPQESVIPYIIYPLENQAPEDIAATLNELIQETTEQQDKAGKILKTTTLRTDDEIIIIADENTFSLIVYASKKNQRWISELIAKLDKRRPQVLIDVTLVQITKADEFAFDLDMISSVPDMSVVTSFLGGGLTDIGAIFTPRGSGRNHFMEFRNSGGIGTGFYADTHINALITAMQTKQYGRVMARPKLLVNDNELGTIQTTTTTYITRTSSNTISGGAGEPVISQSVHFDDYSAGITMEITPHISEGDMLRLEITLNRSAFLGLGADRDRPPDKTDEDVSTVVTVPDRSTIILGGLEGVTNDKGGKKIPILGDLPFIGGLFRSVVKSEKHNKLYIFVKAHILRPGGENALSDLKAISLKNREAFEKLEREMDAYEDWPGLKPEPMDPPHVLEADSDFPMITSRDS